jgi:hypothetical protein
VSERVNVTFNYRWPSTTSPTEYLSAAAGTPGGLM